MQAMYVNLSKLAIFGSQARHPRQALMKVAGQINSEHQFVSGLVRCNAAIDGIADQVGGNPLHVRNPSRVVTENGDKVELNQQASYQLCKLQIRRDTSWSEHVAPQSPAY
jgi:hypothetical protein